MKKHILLIASALLCFGIALQAQEYRNIDGSGNNPLFPNWGAANTTLINYVPFDYADGYAEPGGTDRPNPRDISNIVFNQNSFIGDSKGLSDFLWNFGQFIDHDVTFVPDTSELLVIPTQPDDPFFLGVPIFMNRSLFDPSTGTGPGNPRKVVNIITPFLDGSAVYGSNEELASWLRTFEGGKLKVSQGNLLPFNTVTGEFGDPIDHNAPEMDNPVGIDSFLFMAGDARVNEQPNLIAFHTIFVREHNRLCDTLAFYHPDWNDEELYQYARKMVGGFIQNIVYNEWLPAVGVDIPPYRGYDPSVNPQISNIFSAAAFRLGHTLLNSNILRFDNDGNVIPQGHLTLKDGFFHPFVVYEAGIDPLFKGMAVQTQQEADAKVIGDVRNFLFGQPGSGGLDLASININRGRERGLPSFNEVREALGLSPYPDFMSLTQNADEADALSEAYGGDISLVDPWVGMLAEAPMSGALFGETIIEILRLQFTAIRDGDRFFHLNDPDLDEEKVNEIRNTRMVDIIRRNTTIDIMQDNVFESMPHEEIPTCNAVQPEANIEGGLTTETNQPIDSVKVELFNGFTMMPHYMTAEDGVFHFEDLKTCFDYTVIPYKNDDADAGVTTFDLIKTQRHILNVEFLDSPYKMIAADANHSGNISTADLIDMRRVILHSSDEFPNNTTWRFVPSDYQFENPSNPLLERMPESVMIDMLSQLSTTSFMGIKVGDVDNSVDPSLTGEEVALREELPKAVLSAEDKTVAADQLIEVPVYGQNFREVIGYQFTLNLDPAGLEFVEILPGQISDFGPGNYYWMPDAKAVTLSWNGEVEATADEPLFYLVVRTQTAGRLSGMISLNSRYTPAEAYRLDNQRMQVDLRFEHEDGPVFVSDKYELYQNMPNPVADQTTIGFYLPEASQATLTISDLSGKVLSERKIKGVKGMNQENYFSGDLPQAPGVYLYTLDADFGQISKKLVKK